MHGFEAGSAGPCTARWAVDRPAPRAIVILDAVP